MTIKELKSHFNVFKNGDKYLISEYGKGRRIVNLFLCEASYKNGYWKVAEFKPTKDIERLKWNINEYVKSLPYHSEYYYPLYREGVFEEHIIHDYLSDLGFKYKNGFNDTDIYYNENRDIYGKRNNITLSFNGLSSYNGISDQVTINYNCGDYSWVSVETKRNVDDIKSGIDSILNPLFLTNSATNLINHNKLDNKEQLDLTLNELRGFSLNQVDSKEYLKSKLTELLNTL